MQTEADVLACVEELLTPDGAWIQGYLAQTADGRAVTDDGKVVTPKDPVAAKFCLVGAVFHCADDYMPHPTSVEGTITLAVVKRLTDVISSRQGKCTATMFNDTLGRTQQEILDVVRRAKEAVS